jgi:hypothetical protein
LRPAADYAVSKERLAINKTIIMTMTRMTLVMKIIMTLILSSAVLEQLHNPGTVSNSVDE